MRIQKDHKVGGVTSRMIGTLSRSLRVRDDGTGKRREINGTFAEFESEDAIILLGDPGMGKTTLFRDAAKAKRTTVREFLVDPHISRQSTKWEILP